MHCVESTRNAKADKASLVSSMSSQGLLLSMTALRLRGICLTYELYNDQMIHVC